MFTLQEKLQFVHVDIEYVKALYEACSEVYYMPDEYENKPCIGILLSDGGHKYVLPLTSAKVKHKKWKKMSIKIGCLYMKWLRKVFYQQKTYG